MPVRQAIQRLEPGEMLTGKMVSKFEYLKIWIHRRRGFYDLYVTSTVDPGKSKAASMYRNTVGKDFISTEDLMEAINALDSVYHINIRELLNAPAFIRSATPELIQTLEKQLSRITRSTSTGEFMPDDLLATVVTLESHTPAKPAQPLEAPATKNTVEEDDIVVVTEDHL